MKDDGKIPTPPITADSYLIKLKSMGVPDRIIAAKLGMTEDEVQKRWQMFVDLDASDPAVGLAEFRQWAVILSHQYQLMGQTLGLFTNACLNTYEPHELRDLIMQAQPSDAYADALVKVLLANAVVLKPVQLPDFQKLAEEHAKAIDKN